MEKNKAIVLYFHKTRKRQEACGDIVPLSTATDCKEISGAEITIRQPTVPHYLKASTQVYFIIEGKGKFILNNFAYPIEPGLQIIIPPLTAHYIVPRTIIRAYSVFMPAQVADDCIILAEYNSYIGYSPLREHYYLMSEVKWYENRGVMLDVDWHNATLEDLRDALRIHE